MSLKTLFAALATVVATSGCAVSFSPYGATIHADPYRGSVYGPRFRSAPPVYRPIRPHYGHGHYHRGHGHRHYHY